MKIEILLANDCADSGRVDADADADAVADADAEAGDVQMCIFM